ncbi:hypothetical protein HHI36_004353 [Cryptolaemus montrouzieri]|uniref:RNA-directed DNA polymerase from mobile element jockey-like n=1 Tax=Cryptolaemus montrouzieri TaxID=559131 RepID=A0ABD2NQY5_9CUCU
MGGTRGNDGARSGRSSHVSVSHMSDVELDDPEILRKINKKLLRENKELKNNLLLLQNGIIEMEKNSSENYDPHTELDTDMYYKKEEIDTEFGDILSELKTIKDEIRPRNNSSSEPSNHYKETFCKSQTRRINKKQNPSPLTRSCSFSYVPVSPLLDTSTITGTNAPGFAKKSNLNLLYINTHNMATKIGELENLIDMSNIDISVLTKTWLNESQVNIKGYISAHLYRETKGGGVAIYVKQHIPFIVFSAETFEINAYIHIKIPAYKVNTIAVYKQPKASEKNSLEKMENVLNEKNAICLGDFNIF